MEKDWVKIMDSENTVEVDIVSAKLSDNGVENVILDKKDSAYVVLGRAELYVPANLEEEAMKILNSLTEVS
jgi:hypothetical protein